MRKVHTTNIEEAENLNLTPIMNMVLVLIPLMLLNVVFMTISVIDVTMPQRSAGIAQNGEPPKRLQLFISKQGFTIVKGATTLPAISGCPEGGPAICPNEPSASNETDKQNWLELYNTLVGIKQEPDWQDHETVEIVGDSSIEFGVLVKAMDIARYQRVPHSDSTALKGKALASKEELNESRIVMTEVTGGKANLGMFPVVVLGLPTVAQ